VQTFRTDASSGTAVDVTDHVGGQNPSAADAVSGIAGAVINPSTSVFTAGITGTAQSLTAVQIGATDVTGVDFGYCFDVIVNRNGTGQGSLAQFITNANGLSNTGLAQAGRAAGIDNAIFMLSDGLPRPGMNPSYPNQFPTGVAIIAPSNAPPAIIDPVVLDATTHPRWSGAPVIELSGMNAGAVDALTITASNCVVRGFVIDAWNGNAILLGGNGCTVAGDYLGTNPTGGAASSNNESGVYVTGANNVIGGSAAADRNLVSGNKRTGITITGITATGNTVLGCYVGVDVTGTAAIANLQHGVAVLAGASNNTIGGTAASSANVISGNNVATMNGVYINTGSGNIVQGNRIGTNAAGTAGIPNGDAGVFLKTTSGAIVGGTTAGAANVIAYNSGAGVAITGSSAVGSSVLGNAIFGDAGLGIDLADDGVTPNDGARNTNAPNDDMDYPVFTGASLSGSTLTVAGYVGLAPDQATFAGSRIEIFRADNDATGFGEGAQLVGVLTADLNGNFAGTILGTSLTTGDKITASATDPSGQTSEFGPAVFVVDAISGIVFEDLNYGGGTGRSRAAAAGVPVANARVELFNGAGTFLGADTTDAQGAYSFNALPTGTYTVRVVNGSVVSSRTGGAPGLLPVQTFRTDASSGAGGRGHRPRGRRDPGQGRRG
jgi:hypothetical protein